jgi:hypothetical protein
MVATGPARAGDITFAGGGGNGIQNWTISSSGTTTTITASGLVTFDFSNVTYPPLFNPNVPANFTFTASSSTIGFCDNACAALDGYTEEGFSGSFLYTVSGGPDNGDVLLAGTFTDVPGGTGGVFTSSVNSSGATFDVNGTNVNNQLTLSSSFLNLSGQSEEDASFALSSLNPSFTVDDISGSNAEPAGNYTAAGTSTISSDPGPSGTPEPATFAMIGGGLVFLGLVRRKKLSIQ